MTQHIDPCDTARNNVLAAALALQQCTKTAANIVPIPGTGRFVAIGSRAEVARLFELDTAAATTQASTAQAEPSNEEFEALWEITHAGHPADFAADVLERWGGWPAGILGYGGSAATSSTDAQAAAEVRDAALEEAARICEAEDGRDMYADAALANAAKAIRALRAGDTGEQADGGAA